RRGRVISASRSALAPTRSLPSKRIDPSRSSRCVPSDSSGTARAAGDASSSAASAITSTPDRTAPVVTARAYDARTRTCLRFYNGAIELVMTAQIAPLRTRARDGETTRDVILVAAAGLLAAGGEQGFSIRELCARAGVTAPTVYHHFGDKAALVTRVIDGCFEEFDP